METFLKAFIYHEKHIDHKLFKRFIGLTDEQYRVMDLEFLKYLKGLSTSGRVSEDTYTTRHIIEFLENYKI